MVNPEALAFRDIGPVTEETLLAELTAVRSPLLMGDVSLDDLKLCYQRCYRHSALMLAHWWVESQYETDWLLVPPSAHNPWRMRPRYPDLESGAINGFARFPSLAAAASAWLRRLQDPDACVTVSDPVGGVPARYCYPDAVTLDDYLRIYAPGGDVHPVTGLPNSAINYREKVKAKLRQFAEREESPMVTLGKRKLRIALAAGHRNNSGGNPFETGLTGKVTNALLRLYRSMPELYDVRCVTPGDGLGWYNGSLDAAAGEIVKWASAGWVADIYHEIHFQGLGNTVARGGFIIYPDGTGLRSPYPNPGDLDTDVRDFGPEYARIMCARTGVPVWGSGVMSERQTGVGGNGDRLGVFGATAALYETTTRYITEGATYTNPSDLAIMQQASFPDGHAKALLAANDILAVRQLGWIVPAITDPYPEPAPEPSPDGQAFPQGWDSGLLAWAFGEVTIETTPPGGSLTRLRFNYNPLGILTRWWYAHGKANGMRFPRLIAVGQFYDPLPDGKYQDRREFLFSDGTKVQTVWGKITNPA